MFVVDTNILLYAADCDSPHQPRCREMLEEWRCQASGWYITWGIVYEFLRVATHRNVFQKPLTALEAWGFMKAILASPSLGMLIETERHAAIMAEVLNDAAHISGNLVHDTHTAVLMKEHGIRSICTRDAHFNRFPFLDVIDPVQGARRGTK